MDVNNSYTTVLELHCRIITLFNYELTDNTQ